MLAVYCGATSEDINRTKVKMGGCFTNYKNNQHLHKIHTY